MPGSCTQIQKPIHWQIHVTFASARPRRKNKESTLSEDGPRFQLLRFTQPVTRMTERSESSDVLLYPFYCSGMLRIGTNTHYVVPLYSTLAHASSNMVTHAPRSKGDSEVLDSGRERTTR